MRDYIYKKIRINEHAQVRAIQTIRAYEFLIQEVENIIDERPTSETHVSNSEPSNPTARIAEMRENKLKEIKAVEEGLETIPEDYRAMVYENIRDRRPLESFHYVHKNTLSKYRQKLIIEVAHNLNIISDKDYKNAKGVRK